MIDKKATARDGFEALGGASNPRGLLYSLNTHLSAAKTMDEMYDAVTDIGLRAIVYQIVFLLGHEFPRTDLTRTVVTALMAELRDEVSDFTPSSRGMKVDLLTLHLARIFRTDEFGENYSKYLVELEKAAGK